MHLKNCLFSVFYKNLWSLRKKNKICVKPYLPSHITLTLVTLCVCLRLASKVHGIDLFLVKAAILSQMIVVVACTFPETCAFLLTVPHLMFYAIVIYGMFCSSPPILFACRLLLCVTLLIIFLTNRCPFESVKKHSPSGTRMIDYFMILILLALSLLSRGKFFTCATTHRKFFSYVQ